MLAHGFLPCARLGAKDLSTRGHLRRSASSTQPHRPLHEGKMHKEPRSGHRRRLHVSMRKPFLLLL